MPNSEKQRFPLRLKPKAPALCNNLWIEDAEEEFDDELVELAKAIEG